MDGTSIQNEVILGVDKRFTRLGRRCHVVSERGINCDCASHRTDDMGEAHF